MSNQEILAAGGIVIDNETATPRVLLVHRTLAIAPDDYDTLIQLGGCKLDAGETVEQAALREVKEETGLECRIIRPLTVLRYGSRTRKDRLKPKAVHYFLMERVSGHIQVPGEEVDRAEWFDFNEAASKLTYAQDRNLLSSL